MLAALLALSGVEGLALLAVQETDRSLRGVIDLHCHSGPDVTPRSLTDLELARLARSAGLRAIVLKNHHVPTADRAELARREVGGLDVFGGIVLNRAVGGLNAEAVRKMVQVEGGRGKVVWLPTFDAENHVRHAKEDRPSVPVVREGRPVPELEEIFRLVAEHDLVLATGHSSAEESLLLLPAARKAGVKRLLVTHAMADPIRATISQMKEMAAHGALLECAYLTHLAGPDAPAPSARRLARVTVPEYARAIRELGAERVVLSSDLGQAGNPTHPDGLRAFIAGLKAEGIPEADLDLMTRRNPARLLGLDP
jgi:hypothetical protein